MENRTEYTPERERLLACLSNYDAALAEIERLQEQSRTAREEALEEAAMAMCANCRKDVPVTLWNWDGMTPKWHHCFRGAARDGNDLMQDCDAAAIRELKHKETTNA